MTHSPTRDSTSVAMALFVAALIAAIIMPHSIRWMGIFSIYDTLLCVQL
jgi:hypothetical protein